MKTLFRNALLAAVTAATFATAPAMAADPDDAGAKMPAATQSKEIPFEEMKFVDSGYAAYGAHKPDDHSGKDIMVFNGYGDVLKGQHATIMRWPKGFHSLLHSHTGDYYAVVISGVMSNYRPGQKTPIKKLTAGSYWFQKGGEAHVTDCYSENCMAVLVQNVGFDAQFLGPYEGKVGSGPR